MTRLVFIALLGIRRIVYAVTIDPIDAQRARFWFARGLSKKLAHQIARIKHVASIQVTGKDAAIIKRRSGTWSDIRVAVVKLVEKEHSEWMRNASQKR